MGITEILIVSAFILILIDFFIASDVSTHIAYIVIDIAIVRLIDLPVLYQIGAGIVIWFSLVAFHYTIWRNILEKFNDKYIAPDKHAYGVNSLIGQSGRIVKIDDELFLKINDEIFPFESDEKLSQGDVVLAAKLHKNNIIKVNKIKK